MANLIVTAGRAGSSFLALQLNEHPQVACLNETHYLPLLLDRFEGYQATPGEILRIVDRTRFHDGRNVLTSNFPAMNIDQQAWWDWRTKLEQSCAALTVREFQTRLDAFLCAQTGARIVIDKTPCYGAHLRTFDRYLGDLTVINLTRDARPSIASMLKHPGFLAKVRKRVNTWTDILRHHHVTEADLSLDVRPGEVRAMARLWAWRTMAPVTQASRTQASFVNMRYEDLLDDPRRFFRSVCDVFGLERDDEWIERCTSRIVLPPEVSVRPAQARMGGFGTVGREALSNWLAVRAPDSLDGIERLRAVRAARSALRYT